jgi:hypothetical protein
MLSEIRGANINASFGGLGLGSEYFNSFFIIIIVELGVYCDACKNSYNIL